MIYTKWDQLLDNYKKDEKTNQLIFVQYTGGSRAKVLLYQKTGQKWNQILNCQGYVGENGIDKEKEGDRKTPTGTFELPLAFGIAPNPGAKVPYVQINEDLYWCGDQAYYNQLINIKEHPHSCEGEHLIDYGTQYEYGMFLDYNKACVYGKGSAIFLHCKGPEPYTAGCIAVNQLNMRKILQTVEKGAKICIYPEV